MHPQPRRGWLVRNTGPQKRWKVPQESRVCHFLRHGGFELRPRDPHVAPLHVRSKGFQQPISVELRMPDRQVKIEEVAALLSLVEGPQLGTQQLGQCVGRDGRSTGEPAVRDLERSACDAVQDEVLPSVDLQFEPRRNHWRHGRRVAVDKREAALAGLL